MHYFDNAATTFPKPEEVYKYMDEFYRNFGVNVGRGQFKEASIANKLVEDTKLMLLELFHCNSGNRQVVLTPSATEAMNLVLRGLPFKKDDVVYTTYFEHNATLRTLHFLEKSVGIRIKYLEPDPKTLHYDFSNVKSDFEKYPPKAVVVNHASNVFGVVAPIKEFFNLAKNYNAVTICDMAQTAGLIDTDLLENKCDYAVFAGHKTLYGPFGVAGLVAIKNCELVPLIYGGTGTESANLDMPSDEPIRYEAGSPNIQAIAGLNAALKWIENIGIDNIKAKEQESRNILLEILNQYNNVTVYNFPECDEIGVVSCNFDNYSSDNIGQVLSQFDIAVRTGLHCAPKAHELVGTAPAGTVRLSVNYFTENNDFLALKEALDYIDINS
ncbi:MAG: aminotransferase class V-fold PLP-dependent enzyme [Alphaproteobacteria bacterium]|nr:aminotransferase class V-fold PLP-dependent enzyme [Alphaproteobacteria bacterium]